MAGAYDGGCGMGSPVSDDPFIRLMRQVVYVATIGAVLLYGFWLYPNFKQCRAETGHWRACVHWLVR